MRHIRKGVEPKELRDWKRDNRNTPVNLFYGHGSTFPAGAVKEALLKEQRHLCAYTMKRLSTIDDCHLEHIHPRSITKKDLATQPLEVDYNNMLACFPAKSDRSPGYGAPWKDDYDVTESNFVSPLHGSCETRFQYNSSGEVACNAGDAAAGKTIEALKLNHKVLVELRERVLQAYGIKHRGTQPISAKKARELVESIMQPDSNGFLPEYCVAIRQVAERYAHKEEQWASAKKRSQGC